MQQTITIHGFNGGIANDDKIGQPNSFRFARNLNILQDANYLTPAPKTVKVSSTTVTNLPLWAVDGSPYTTNKYFYDLGGNLYQCTSSDVFSNIRTVSNSQGQGLAVLDNYLYYAGNITLGRYGHLDDTPTFSDNFLADGTTDLDQSQTLTGNTYTPPTAISETATNRQSFTPTRDPMLYIQFYVTAKGTGNWTVTLHDSNNLNLGTATIANASLTNGALNSFLITARVVIGNTYHVHVTSTVADGTLRTGTASDLETSTFKEFFGILLAAPYHPMEQLLNGIVIGNDDYLAFWDQANYNPNQITLERGYQVRTLTRENEYVVAGAWKGDSETSVESAKLYYWDGIAPTFNYSVPVGMGLPNALAQIHNKLVGVYGESGNIYMNSAPFQLVHTLPLLTAGKTVEVAPGGITEFQSDTAIGYSFSNDDSTGLQNGVYVWGNKTEEFPECLSFPYTISTGNTQATNLKIGLVKGIGDNLYIGWRDNTTYGVDKVTKTNDPFTTGEFYSLIFDNEAPQKPKYIDALIVEFNPLISGETITPKYAIDGNAYSNTFTTGTAQSTVGATQARFPIGKRFYDISVGFNWTTSTTYFKVTGILLIVDDESEERSY